MKLALLVPCFEVCSLLSPDESEIDVERTLELTSYSPHYVNYFCIMLSMMLQTNIMMRGRKMGGLKINVGHSISVLYACCTCPYNSNIDTTYSCTGVSCSNYKRQHVHGIAFGREKVLWSMGN